MVTRFPNFPTETELPPPGYQPARGPFCIGGPSRVVFPLLFTFARGRDLPRRSRTLEMLNKQNRYRMAVGKVAALEAGYRGEKLTSSG
ncbi:SPBc2 prophage-derived protein BhlA [Anopheles sinensis]|uniref:SPBc2 prophage-derived protein BhlA n=1 Tax=Anopheles sinensis TaxID=74873 RepID=A0A084VTH3_ANOSI|nr:SPBc2 prophage-derived protein BhlA [Anopheles sinensis]